VNADERTVLERELAEACAAGEHERAATLALRGYGPEVLGFLVALGGQEQVAADAFSQLCEDLWRGLPDFAGRCSFRTWMYTLARHALLRGRRGDGRRERRQLPEEALERIAEQVRSQTLPFLRTAVRDRMTELRATLPAEDQALLVLRVDRQLDWNELARVLSEGPELEGDALKREAARLRKRFQLVKDRLREMAEREGLLGAKD
jgi:RNA polymerase sigma-70 factor, ECF subfamily